MSVGQSVTHVSEKWPEFGQNGCRIMNICYLKDDSESSTREIARTHKMSELSHMFLQLPSYSHSPPLFVCPRLLDYMGDSNNGVNPMKIKAHIAIEPVEVKEVKEVNATVTSPSHTINPAGFNISFDYCYVSYNGSTPCSCQDCAKSCGAPSNPIVDPKPRRIMGNVILSRYIRQMKHFCPPMQL